MPEASLSVLINEEGQRLEASEELVLATRQLLTLLEKTHKTVRLYQGDNEVSRRLESELAAATDSHLNEWGPLELAITEHSMLVQGESVYEVADRTDSLAFLFHRDGIRRLSLLPGLEAGELKSFLRVLNRVSVVANEADDLVTLFWERDFSHIKYFAVEELSEDRAGPSIAEQLATGSLEGADGAVAGGEAVSLDDVSRPVARMPVRECVLTEEEVEALHREFDDEESEDSLMVAGELAMELVGLDASDADRASISNSLVATLDEVLEQGPAWRIINLWDRMRVLVEGLEGDFAEAVALLELLRSKLASPRRVRMLLALVEREPRELAADELRIFLARLGENALPAVVEAMGSLGRAPLRRAASEVVLGAGSAAVEQMCRHMKGQNDPKPELVAEMLYVARRLDPADGMVVIHQLMSAERIEVRRQAALALGPYQEGAVGETWVELLGDHDAEMRGLALTALARGGRAELAQPIAEITMLAEFENYDVEEKRRFFAAIARIGGELSMPWLLELLRRPHRRHFLPRADKELINAAVHGLSQLPRALGRPMLEELLAAGDRHVKAACRKALKELDDG